MTIRYVCKRTLKNEGKITIVPFGVLLKRLTTDPDINGDIELLLADCVKVDENNYPHMLSKTANNAYKTWVVLNEGTPQERYEQVPRTVDNIKPSDQAYYDRARQFLADTEAAFNAGTLEEGKKVKRTLLEAFVAQWPGAEA